jgi:hypothetical protein
MLACCACTTRARWRGDTGLCGLVWMDYAPGCFATATQRTGVLRVWNVSQRCVYPPPPTAAVSSFPTLRFPLPQTQHSFAES